MSVDRVGLIVPLKLGAASDAAFLIFVSAKRPAGRANRRSDVSKVNDIR